MQILFWIIIIFLLMIVLYQFLPSVQIYVDDKFSSFRKVSNFVEDHEYHVPHEIAHPLSSVSEHQQERMSGYRRWGNTSVDGPDRAMPHQCWWKGGILYCKNHPIKN